MQFLLVDTGIALAALLGYWAFAVLARQRAKLVTLASGVTARSDRTRRHEEQPNAHKGTAKPHKTYLDVSGVDPSRLVNLR
jgi:hypothetical protein